MIGGEHYLLDNKSVKLSLSNFIYSNFNNNSFFSSGRDALYALLKSLPQNTIYLPDLVCDSIYNACRQSGKKIKFYEINENFIENKFDLQKINKNSCILIIHFFGIPNIQLINNLTKSNTKIISDVTHIIFNKFYLKKIYKKSDYLLTSLRKIGPFPDGGILSSNKKKLPKPINKIRENFFTFRLAGIVARTQSILNKINNDEGFYLIKKAEKYINNSSLGGFDASNFSKNLTKSICYKKNALQISKNIHVLNSLKKFNSIGVVNDNNLISPYYVCLFKNKKTRDRIKVFLSKKNIFCPIHWESKTITKKSILSNRILSIPCDVRYNQNDMKMIINNILLCIEN